MEAKVYLERMNKITRLIENKLYEIQQWEHIAQGTSAPVSGERVQSSGSLHKMEDAVIKMNEIRESIAEKVTEYIEIQQDVINTIEKLDSSYYDILHKRYIQGMNLYEISIVYNRSISSVRKKHGKALKQVQNILNEREKN